MSIIGIKGLSCIDKQEKKLLIRIEQNGYSLLVHISAAAIW
jgi:hypothetical protein